MNKNEFFKTIFGYFKHHIKSILMFTIFIGVFALIFSLYNASTEPISYAVALCIFVGIIFTLYDFYKYFKKHKALYMLKSKITVCNDELLRTSDLIENDYYELINAVHDDKIRLISEYDNDKKEMIDYYTLWAHQIKTPISAMRLLLQAEDSSENRELTAELFKVEQYVEMVLSYLRLGSNSTDFIIKMYPLDKIVKDAVHKYAPMFIRKKIALKYDDLNINVLTDEKWLTFVIEQILSNSLKYTNKGEITICLESPKILVIKDTGIGIEKEDLPRICENGFTGYNGRSDKKATGIGLYLSKQILEKLSHTINIVSEVGIGTAVRISLQNINIDIE